MSRRAVAFFAELCLTVGSLLLCAFGYCRCTEVAEHMYLNPYGVVIQQGAVFDYGSVNTSRVLICLQVVGCCGELYDHENKGRCVKILLSNWAIFSQFI